jgi:hypothetical protein
VIVVNDPAAFARVRMPTDSAAALIISDLLALLFSQSMPAALRSATAA